MDGKCDHSIHRVEVLFYAMGGKKRAVFLVHSNKILTVYLVMISTIIAQDELMILVVYLYFFNCLIFYGEFVYKNNVLSFL